METKVEFYSDGDIEDKIIETLKAGKDVFDIPYNGGAVFHNFTDARENLINWYPFEKDASVLEIGAGMGALTGLLCQKCDSVTAFEHSPKRAEIIRYRYPEYSNLNVVCGDVLSYNFEQKYDYIMLIGVLEYMGINSTSVDPYSEILLKINQLLKPNGILLLAIENRFGLKYWCGAAEDHTGVPFDGISGYQQNSYTTRYHKSGVKTFSRDTLKKYLEKCGFQQSKWFYPMPDYKFPTMVFSDEYLPGNADVGGIKFSYPQESRLVADERKVYPELFRNQVFPFFANSFLVEAHKGHMPESEIIYASLKRDYKSEYRLATLISNQKKVIKKCLTDESQAHLEKFKYNADALEQHNIRMIPFAGDKNQIVQEWQEAPRVDQVIKDALNHQDVEKVTLLIDELKEQLRMSSMMYLSKSCVCSPVNYKFSFNDEKEILIDGYIDMTFVNSFYIAEQITFFDQEWRFQDVPLNFIVYRALKYCVNNNSDFELLVNLAGITREEVEQYDSAETMMLQNMMDVRKCNMFDPGMYHDALTLEYQDAVRADEVLRLNQEKAALQSEINSLQKETEDLQDNIKQLNASCTKSEQLCEQLREQSTSYSRELEDATSKLNICLEENKKLQTSFKKQSIDKEQFYEQQLADKNQTILNKEGHIEQLLEVEREYEREKHSRTYRLALKFRSISLWFFPVNSKRRFFAKAFLKGLRHPLLMCKMINPKRIRNAAIILKTEGVESAEHHYQLVEEYEKSRSVPLNNEALTVEEVSQKELNFEDYAPLTFPQWDKPQVSIVIPVYNQFDYTWHCLESIMKNSEDCTYEVIIANDCSTDLTTRLEEIVSGVRMITNKENLRFLLNCNHAAEYAKGEYILFLNNDTQVQPGWLRPLISLMEKDSAIGMVGSKLLYPDGYLQEAGGILWRDGSAWNYGNRQNPENSEFNYVHEADYISGAAIMIRTSLWKEIGGFDQRFVPAYCEDSDLAFEVRRHGYKVMYQPQSVVVHFEGISNGTDLASGQKKYQVDNQQKFLEKWKNELEKDHFENGTNVFLARERSCNRKHVLVIDHYVPQYDKDAGSKTTFMYLKMLVKKGYQVTFLGDNFYPHQPYTSVLQQMGILVLYGPKYAENCKEWLIENLPYFDVVYLNRPHITIKYIDLIKEHARGRIIYYGHDLHFLRIHREYELSGDKKLLEESEKWKEQELYIMYKADMNYYPSEVECTEIHKIDPDIPVKAITAYVYDRFQNIAYMPEKRDGLLFVGGFGHTPNLDAVQWFLDKIYPEVYQTTHAPFYIVGSNAPKEITELTTEGVVVKGFVSEEELQQLYSYCRMAVVPLRYGAGVKGKVVEALYYGIPIVTTSVGAEGIEGVDDIVAVQDEEKALIETITKLYDNRAALIEMHNKSQKYICDHFSTDAAWSVIAKDFNY